MRHQPRPAVLAVLTALVVLLPVKAFAAPIGPSYPMPGGPGVGHGGSTCKALSDAEAAAGKDAVDNGTADEAGSGGTPGQTWHYGAGTEPAQEEGCAFSATPSELQPFDTTRFDRLFWGITSTPALSLNADGDTTDLGETMSFDSVSSDRAAGRLVWTGSTSMTWCQPTSCASFTESPELETRFVLTATDFEGDPVALLDPVTVGLPAAMGGVVEVTEDLTNYRVNVVMLADDPSTGAVDLEPAISMYNDYNHPPQNAPQTQMSVGAAFYFLSRAPIGSIGGPATPEAGEEVTYSAGATDPDGSPGDSLSYAWDTDDDGQFDDGTAQTVDVTYAAGQHDLAVQVTDADGVTAVLTRTVTAADTTAPGARLRLKRLALGAVVRKGVQGSLTISEAARATLSATIPKALAERLDLSNPIAKSTVMEPGAETIPFALQLTKAARNKLGALQKVTIAVKAVVVDTAGNRTVVKQERTYST